jgi:hypothetical protein
VNNKIRNIKDILIMRLHGLLGYKKAKDVLVDTELTKEQAERLLDAVMNFDDDNDVEDMDVEDILGDE